MELAEEQQEAVRKTPKKTEQHLMYFPAAPWEPQEPKKPRTSQEPEQPEGGSSKTYPYPRFLAWGRRSQILEVDEFRPGRPRG